MYKNFGWTESLLRLMATTVKGYGHKCISIQETEVVK